MQGKLIVIEGGDGSGKATQTELLKAYFKKEKIPTNSLTFPQYTSTFFGKTIARILQGKIAPLPELNSYLLAMVYAMDRAEARDKMYRWLNRGMVVLLDRYVSSNMAHQTGRLPKKEHARFLKWLEELEYHINNIPREDLVIFLYMPHLKAQELIQNKGRKKGSHDKKTATDIVEGNLEYLKNAEKIYLSLYKRFRHWVKIDCVDKDGKIKSREAIHAEVLEVLKEKRII